MEVNEIRLQAMDLNQQGSLLLKAGNPEAAKAKFEQAIELDPMLVDSYVNFGDYHMSQDAPQDAKVYYKKGLLIEKRGELYFRMGNACFLCDEPHEGLRNYNLALSAGFDSDEMFFFMGLAYDHMNDDVMALRYFQKASQKNPSRPDYMVKKIQKFAQMRMLEEAEAASEELLNIAPELFDAYHIKTNLLLERKKLAEAVEFSRQASDRFPEDAELMHDHIRCLALNQELEAAAAKLRIAKQLKYYDSAKRKLTMLEAEVEAERGNLSYAMDCCKACIAMEAEGETDGEARFMLLNLYLSTENLEQALNQAKELITRAQKDTYFYTALYYRAMCQKRLGMTEEAKASFKEANSFYRLETLRNPGAVDIYMFRAMCLRDMEDYDKALEILDFVLGITTEVAEVYILKSDVYQAMGNERAAQEEAEKAYKLKPQLRPSGKDGE